MYVLVVPWILTLLKGPAHTGVVVGGFVMGLAMGALVVGEVVTGALVVGEVETGALVVGEVETGALIVGEVETGALVVGEFVIGAALCTNAKMMLAMIDKVQSEQS
jgi:hypothetical protein